MQPWIPGWNGENMLGRHQYGEVWARAGESRLTVTCGGYRMGLYTGGVRLGKRYGVAVAAYPAPRGCRRAAQYSTSLRSGSTPEGVSACTCE